MSTPPAPRRRAGAVAAPLLLLLFTVAASVIAQTPPSGERSVAPATAVLDMVGGGGRPLLQVRAGSAVGAMILDTGAATTLLLRSFADAAGARVIGPTSVNSPLGGTPLEAVFVEVEELVVAERAFGPVRAIAIDDDAFPLPGGALGVVPVGLLYRDGVVEMDFAAGILTLADRPTEPIAHWTTRDPSDEILRTALEVGPGLRRGLSVDVHIDTGSPGGLLLPERHARDLGLEDQLTPVGSIRTIDAERTLSRADYDGTITVAGLQLTIDQLLFADVPVANLGAGPLNGQVLVWDRGGERFAFRTSNTQRAQPSAARAGTDAPPPPRLGLMARPSPEAIDVVDTEEGSRARRAGLRAGDRIVAVDGRPLAEIAPADRGRALSTADTLTVEREGATIEISLPAI